MCLNWKKYTLGDLYTVHNGLSKNGKFFGRGYPFLSFSTVFNNYFIPQRIPDLVESTEKEQENYSIKRGDVFVTRTSETKDELGMSCVALQDYPMATYNGFTKRLRPHHPDVVLPEFIGYYLRNPSFRQKFKAFSQMTTRASLKNENLLGLVINIPNCLIQKKIASILSTYDTLIENNQKQIKLLEEAAQRFYKEWFIDFHFPGHKDVKIVNGIPEGWNIVSSNSKFGITIGKTPCRSESQWFMSGNTGVKWASISDMKTNGPYLQSTSEALSAEAITKFNVKIVPKGTILLSFKLTVGRIAIAAETMATNEAIAHFHVENDALRWYLYLYLKNFEYSSLGNTSSISTAINSKIVKNMPIILPSDEIIDNFATLVSPYFKQIYNLQRSILLLSEARDRLLPKLMSGEIEVTP